MKFIFPSLDVVRIGSIVVKDSSGMMREESINFSFDNYPINLERIITINKDKVTLSKFTKYRITFVTENQVYVWVFVEKEDWDFNYNNVLTQIRGN